MGNEQTPLGFSGTQPDGQQAGQSVSPEGGAQAAGAQQVQYVTLEEARRMMQEAVAEALRQAQSHTDKTVAHLTERLGRGAGVGAQASDGAAQVTPVEQDVSQERVEWANREAQRIYEQLGEVLTGSDDDAPFRALLDESSPEAFIRTLPAAVIAKRLARGNSGGQNEIPSSAAARATALTSGGMATRAERKYDDIPNLIGRGMDQALPRRR